MWTPVVSIPYEIARHITKKLLDQGIITEKEFKRIDLANQHTFIQDELAISAK